MSGHGRSVFVAVLGNTIEYFDVTLYGLFAVFISKAFFPSEKALTGLLATYAIFIISYAVRPVAGLLLGRLADLRGHRFVLVLTINLMTLGTFGIGLLPSYQSIGIVAPLMLVILRTIQGIGASAEYTVATSYALENGPTERRNTAAGWSNAGANVGPMIASAIAMTLALTLGDEFIAKGGWRAPFLLSVPMGLLAFYLRRQMVDDGLLHTHSKSDLRRARIPLFVALRGHWSTVATVIAMCAGQRIGGICIQAYFVTALIRLGYSGAVAMLVSIALFALGIPACWIGGRLADRFGGRPVQIGGFGIYTVLAVPLFMVMGVSVPLTMVGLFVCTMVNNILAPPLSLAVIMSFPREIRGAASALNFNIGTALIGSTAPLIATSLDALTGSEAAFGWYWAAICLVSLLTAVFAYPERLMGSKTD